VAGLLVVALGAWAEAGWVIEPSGLVLSQTRTPMATSRAAMAIFLDVVIGILPWWC